jgi:TNF receptor-associated protein 1
MQFQAETRQLLDIVARSLYSEKEVFIRELISNASDAVEKMRYLSLQQSDIIGAGNKLANQGRALEINIATDKVARTITIADTGIGMTKEEMVLNLGTIARSGSKAFMKEMVEKGEGKAAEPKDIIGQFGVGFYSAFMVADKIEVFSKSSKEGSTSHRWLSDGLGTFEIQEADSVADGTKIIVHLKKDCSEFADENKVRDVIKKYSSFVGCPIDLNGTKSNELRPVWLLDPKEVSAELHEDFYRYVSNSYDKPRFIQHFRADAPLDIRALFYVPESRPGLFESSRDASDTGVALYCRKILIKSKADNIVPRWMRFVKGVVDSEDIPLNLSRELLQDSSQIRKLRTVVANKFLRFIQERARKEKKSFLEFYKDYSFFFKEGILMSTEQYEKEELAKVLRFESSKMPEGELVTLPEYCDRMKAGQRDVFYLSAPSRQLAESSPYLEALKKRTDDVEIFFCYESYDELVLMQLQEFDKKKLTSVEKDMRDSKEEEATEEEAKEAIPAAEQSGTQIIKRFTIVIFKKNHVSFLIFL